MSTATAARRVTAGSEPVLFLAAFSWAAAAIHAVVAVPHFAEHTPFGVAFLATALAQLAWGVLVYRRPEPACLAAGLGLNATVVLGWIVSRTAGLPLGPEAGQAEAPGFPDLAASADELALIALAASLLAKRTAADGLGLWVRQGALVVLIFCGVALMAAGHTHT
jgi:hypothetical protein